jgi:hypothetical protein
MKLCLLISIFWWSIAILWASPVSLFILYSIYTIYTFENTSYILLKVETIYKVRIIGYQAKIISDPNSKISLNELLVFSYI